MMFLYENIFFAGGGGDSTFGGVDALNDSGMAPAELTTLG